MFNYKSSPPFTNNHIHFCCRSGDLEVCTSGPNNRMDCPEVTRTHLQQLVSDVHCVQLHCSAQ